MALLGGTAAVLFAFGRFDYLGWKSAGDHVQGTIGVSVGALDNDAVARIEENSTRLDLLLESSPVGIAFLDRDLRVARASRTFARQMGY